MSRVGKKPIPTPDKVTITCADGSVTVKGPLGALSRPLHSLVSIKVNGGETVVERANDSREARALHGLYRALIANMVTGVSEGYQKSLDLVGVGYRAELKGSDLKIALGYSHPVEFKVPEGLKAQVEKQTRIVISGADKELVGETAAKIRSLRLPEPYKGKGVRYSDETIRRKAGKAAAGGAK